MSISHPQDSRIQTLNDKPVQDGAYVLYWMQSSQRAEDNYALEYAIQRANDLDKPLLVAFGLMDDYPEANLRHYVFMLEGLAEVETSLKQRDIRFVVQQGSPDEVAIRLSEDACVLITDRGYLRLQKWWRERVASEADCQVVQVEDNVVVPIEQVSDKAEYSARTIRPKINRRRDDYLVELRTTSVNRSSLALSVSGLDINDPLKAAKRLKLNTDVPPVTSFFQGGTTQAKRTLAEFLDERFATYQKNRNQPQTNDTSYMGMYLHFGQISPVYIALKVKDSGAARDNIDSYLEELIVRRELTVNFCYYTEDYDSYSCIPDWAKKTLNQHRDDPRDPSYTREQLESARTDDPYWNAAMNEMRVTGYMHNYMRMYWGKKVIEWSSSPEYAFETLQYLNNTYFLDGRDTNSYSNIAWCFGVHDRAWTERKILGKLRYMNANGLKRKADPDAYVEKVNELMAKVS
jgi:deoxyribodipyrimidine photo-lyase